MEEGRKVLEEQQENLRKKEEGNKMGKEGFGFNFLGKKGREGDEFTLRAVHGYKCK